MSIAEMQTVQLALVAVAALALALQTIMLISILVVARGAVRSIREELEHYRSSVMPVVLRSRELLQNVAPRIEEAAGDLSSITRSLRAQTADIEVAANDIIARAQRQAGRVDRMLTAIFDHMERVGTFVSEAVAKPMRQFSGLIASVKAVVETLRDPEAAHRHPPQGASRYPDGEPIPAPRASSTYRP